MSLRLLWRPQAPVHLRPSAGAQLPQPGERAASRPHRHPGAGAGGALQGAKRRHRRALLGIGARNGGDRPGAPGPAAGGQRGVLQRPDGHRPHPPALPPEQRGAELARKGHGAPGAIGPGLWPHPQDRPHHRRPGGQRDHRPAPPQRGHRLQELGQGYRLGFWETIDGRSPGYA